MAASCGVPFGSVVSSPHTGGWCCRLPSLCVHLWGIFSWPTFDTAKPSQIIIAQTEEGVGVKAFTSASRDLGTVVSRGGGGSRGLWIGIKRGGFWPSGGFHSSVHLSGSVSFCFQTLCDPPPSLFFHFSFFPELLLSKGVTSALAGFCLLLLSLNCCFSSHHQNLPSVWKVFILF